jgi:hypothetical protein
MSIYVNMHRLSNFNFRHFLLLCIFQVTLINLCSSADAGGRKMIYDPKLPSMTCYNRNNYPEAKATVYWKSTVIDTAPYPTIASDFFLNLFRKAPGSGATTDVGFDHKSSIANAGSVNLYSESLVNITGTYRALVTIGTDAIIDPTIGPPFSQEVIVCNK